MVYQFQHLCTSGVRQFESLDHVIGEFIHRNEADGTVESSVWIACIEGWRMDGSCSRTADFPKQTVEPRSCDDVIRQAIASRATSERGQFPGETPDGKPDGHP